MTANQQDPKPRRIVLLIGNARYSDERLAPSSSVMPPSPTQAFQWLSSRS